MYIKKNIDYRIWINIQTKETKSKVVIAADSRTFCFRKLRSPAIKYSDITAFFGRRAKQAFIRRRSSFKMSNTHRPTYYAPIGQKQVNIGMPTFSFSVKDQTAHTKMKYRAQGQSSSSEMRERNLAEELERKELQLLHEKNKNISVIVEEEKKVDTTKFLLMDKAQVVSSSAAFDDADAKGSDDGFESSRSVSLTCHIDICSIDDSFSLLFFSSCFSFFFHFFIFI